MRCFLETRERTEQPFSQEQKGLTINGMRNDEKARNTETNEDARKIKALRQLRTFC
jgi:hypothetical protein